MSSILAIDGLGMPQGDARVLCHLAVTSSKCAFWPLGRGALAIVRTQRQVGG